MALDRFGLDSRLSGLRCAQGAAVRVNSEAVLYWTLNYDFCLVEERINACTGTFSTTTITTRLS